MDRFLCNAGLFLVLFFNHILFSTTQKLPLILGNSEESVNATRHAWNLLQEGNSLLDSLERGLSEGCELQYCGDGTGSLGDFAIDETGDGSLDAMIMNGDNYDVGAVAGLRHVRKAISVARAVMEYTDHTFIVGDDATKFAEEMNFELEDIRNEETNATWWDWKNNNCQPNFRKNVTPNPEANCGPYEPINNENLSRRHKQKMARTKANTKKQSEGPHDTQGMIIIDEESHVVVGLTTNGLRHKVAGRVGDSPVAGCGGYAVTGIGAAFATGNGDIYLRFLPALIAVEALREGKTPAEAAREAFIRVTSNSEIGLNIFVANAAGDYAAMCSGVDKKFNVMHPGLDDVTVIEVECEQLLK